MLNNASDFLIKKSIKLYGSIHRKLYIYGCCPFVSDTFPKALSLP